MQGRPVSESATLATTTVPYLDLVDPDLRTTALALRDSYDPSPMTMEKLQARRDWIDSMVSPPLDDVPWQRVEVSRDHCPADPGAIEAFLVGKPHARGSAVLHIHGGGYTASRAVNSLPAVQTMARALECPILTVDYRLAPEAIWSQSLEDNYAAWLWLQREADRLGIDPHRIALLGESAGGGHAALLAFAIRDRGETPAPSFMNLVYPMLDDRAGTSRKIAPHIGYFGWNPAMNLFGWSSLLGFEAGTADVPEQAVPSRRHDLAGLPPAWIGVGGLDLFAGESMQFASDLNDAGVPVEALLVPGAFHGFDSFAPDAPLSKRFTEAKLDALRRALNA